MLKAREAWADDRRPVLRAVALFLVLSAVPLCLLTWFAVDRSAAALRQEAETNLRRTAGVTAVAIEKEMQGLLEVVQSYARQRTLDRALQPSDVDRLTIRRELSALFDSRVGIATTFVASADGRLVDIVPPTPAIVGGDFSYRDWYRGVIRTGAPYVSEAYESLAAGHPRVVAAAAPIQDADGSTRGILVAAYGLETLQRFVESFGTTQGVDIEVTDQRGVVVAAPGISLGDLVSAAVDPAVRDALDGGSGTMRRSVGGRDVLSGYAPIGRLGWAVVTSVPESEVLAPASRVRAGVYAMAAILFVALLARLVVLARSLTARDRAEREAERARAEAEAANTAKSEFLSRMSHELRTPLNAVLGFGQLLEMGDLRSDQAESVEQIVKAGRHLLDLINEVLDMSSVEAGRISLSLEPVSMSDAVAECIELARPLADATGVTVAVDIAGEDAEATGAETHDVFAVADRHRLRQVLLNLVSNAIKYNRPGGSVSVRGRPVGGAVELAVSDTGVGIPAELLSRAFTPFDRLGAEGTGVEGTGLGLSLSKLLVEAMRGSIEVTSEVGSGTTVRMRLPLSRGGGLAAAEPAGRWAFRVDPGPRGTVLYIEDNASNVRLLEGALRHRPNVRLLTSAGGRAGLALAVEVEPDVILLDLHLPDMTGDQVLDLILANPRTNRIPVLVMSADATSARSLSMVEAGARGFIAKPIDVSGVLQTLDRLLDESTTRRESATA